MDERKNILPSELPKPVDRVRSYGELLRGIDRGREGALANGSDLISPVSRTGLRLASDERLVALVRRGSGRMATTAFEVLYERHVRGLLSFCVYMLGSRDDAEDAVQSAFAAAHRSLQSTRRQVAVRPWLFAIARNECIDILRKRRPTVELNGEPATTGDPVKTLQLREEVRGIFEDVRRLPERQRTALVLAEVDGLSQAEIGGILGVRSEQVKAYVFQARTNLISDRGAREADCADIREQLATARGAALRRARIRRHTRSCAGCRAYAESIGEQRRQLAALVPVAPTLGLKYRVLEQLFGLGGADPSHYAEGAAIGSAITGAIAELAGGGMKALAAKVAAGVLALGATAEVGMSVLATKGVSHPRHGATAGGSGSRSGTATVQPVALASVEPGSGSRARSRTRVGEAPSGASVLSTEPAAPGGEAPSSGGGLAVAEQPAGSTEGQPAPSPASPAPARGPSAGAPGSASGESWRTGSMGHAHAEEHAQRHGERESQRAGRQKLREERKASREQGGGAATEEEAPEVGMSGAPKRTPQERQEMHEEHERRREERKREREERKASK